MRCAVTQNFQCIRWSGVIISMAPSCSIGRFKSIGVTVHFPGNRFFLKSRTDRMQRHLLIVVPDGNSFTAPSGNVNLNSDMIVSSLLLKFNQKTPLPIEGTSFKFVVPPNLFLSSERVMTSPKQLWPRITAAAVRYYQPINVVACSSYSLKFRGGKLNLFVLGRFQPCLPSLQTIKDSPCPHQYFCLIYLLCTLL